MAELMMKRRTFCRDLILGTAGLAVRQAHSAQTPKRHNILLITTDDLGPYLGCYGDTQARTPHLDKLAKESMRFELAFVTQPSCSPSRSSMFTGLYPHQNGQIGLSHRGYSMDKAYPTLPSLLKQGGYRTGVIGKIHVAPDAAFPFDFRKTAVGLTRDVGGVAGQAEGFMRRSGDRPFFLMVNYFDPHRPLVDQVKGVPAKPLGPDDVTPFAFLGVDTPKVRKEVAGYYNCVTRADVGVGLLMERLAKTGHADDTVVIFLGDHGPPFTRAKTTCYEAGLRIPFIVRWPGRGKSGQVRQEMISTVDILPTVMDAAGLPAPEGLPGQSLTPLIEGKSVPWRETLCAEYTSHGKKCFFPRRSIRDRRYKLILNLLGDRPNPVKAVDGCAAWEASRDPKLEGTPARLAHDTCHRPPRVELYDLEKDPIEFRNLAGKAEFREIEKRLLVALEQWRKLTRDPLLDPEKLAALARSHDEAKRDRPVKKRAKR